MEAWDSFLHALEKRLSKGAIQKWVRPLKVVNYDACNLYLKADNSFQIAWFEEHVGPIAVRELVNNNGRRIKVHFQREKKKQASSIPLYPKETPFVIKPDFIDPVMTFSNFIFDEKSTLTIEFLQKLSPGAFNPLFLYGEKGVGKTHLLQAVGNKLMAQGLCVFYVHAETFTQHVVEAIRSSQMRTFREIYRYQDVLIVDDIHQFARRVATQEEFFHTFNALHTSGKQLILCSHFLPSQIEDIEPRLTSRFEWGILLDLSPLPPEKMRLVLQNKAHLHHFPLSNELCNFLIDAFPTSSKSMMRGLEALMVRHRSDHLLTVDEVKKLLADLLREEEKLRLTPEKIIGLTAGYYGIRKDDILGKSQSKECTNPRKVAMFLCRKHLTLSYQTIGRHFYRDHSTVMAAVRQIEKKSYSEEVEAALAEIEMAIKS